MGKLPGCRASCVDASFRITLVLFTCALARAQISPGPLSRAHQQLEGVSKCASCHDFGAGARGFKCLECHAEIRRRVEQHAGFHSRAFRNSAGQTDCARCHMEHNGQAFALMRLDRNTLDHLAQTGFALEGKHRGQKCENCHSAKRVDAAARAEIKLKDLNRSFLGLRRECASCHEDPHRGQLGAECARCHAQETFKQPPGFSHARTAFPLTGLHQPVACQKCHGPRPGADIVQYKGLAFSSCQGCHTDPHRGAFQETGMRGSCDRCHNTNGWTKNRPGSDFRHDTTKFPLVGKHAETACSQCHKGGDFRRPVAHQGCRDCHEDPHRSQFADRPAGSDCSACHDQKHFKPSRFDLERHRQSAFPLEGKHAPLPCVRCHQPEGRGAAYITGKLACSACHADPHAGEFASVPHVNQCNQCHTASGFQPTTFSVARHEQTQFPLTGRHESVACANCHKPLAPPRTALPPDAVGKVVSLAAPRQYRFPSRNCAACHTDPHQTKVACETCHTTQPWKEVLPFDHSMTQFRLTGAHQEVKCVQCHNPSASRAGAGANQASDPTSVVNAKLAFSNTPGRCAGCHAAKDPHGGQFRGRNRDEDCSACHLTERWNIQDFDHDRTRFALDRAHRNVSCAKCHKAETEVAGRLSRMYRGTPTECVKCH